MNYTNMSNVYSLNTSEMPKAVLVTGLPLKVEIIQTQVCYLTSIIIYVIKSLYLSQLLM